MKLTKATIARLEAPDPSGKQRLWWDDELKGFGLVVSGATATKSFVVQRGVDGRKRRVTLTTLAELEAAGKSVDDVRAEAAELLVEMRKGKDPRARRRGERTLKEWTEEFFAARPNLSPRTRRTYADALVAFAKWEDRPLAELTPDDLERAYRGIKAATAKRAAARLPKGRERSALFVSEPGAGAANTALGVLRSVWLFAQGRDPERVPPWPTARLRGQWFRVGRRERHVRAEDLKKFYEAVDARDATGEFLIGRLMRDFVLFLLLSGMRREEAASLRWADVDLGADVVRVSAFRTKAKRRLELPMSAPLRALLANRRALGVDASGYVFPGDGEAGYVREPRKALAALSARLGFPINAHALRSTYATIVHDTPMPPLCAKGLLNHAVGNDVTAGYVQLTTESLRKPAEDVGERIAALCGIAASAPRRPRSKRAPPASRSAGSGGRRRARRRPA